MQALTLISLFLGAFIVFACLICSASDDANAADDVKSALRYQGVLYIGKSDKAIDCFRHLETGNVYYKQGEQYRSATTGRIVSTSNALAGVY